MIRTLTASPSGEFRTTEGPDDVRPPEEGAVRWIDLASHDEADVKLLGERFGFHPLALEDCLNFDQRPKLEEYGDHLFLVVHGFQCATKDPRDLTPVELHAFLGKGYLVTVHSDAAIEPLEAVFKRVRLDQSLLRRGADFVHYMVVDALVDQDFRHVDLISDALDDIEEAVLTRAEQRDVAYIFELKRTLVTMRRVLSPQRDMLALLARRETAIIDARTAVYYRDVYDHLIRISEAIEAARDVLGNALDAYLSTVAQRTNEVMKRLTILSAIFMPLTFITGFFGQNLDALPIHGATPFVLMVTFCLIVPTVMYRWFRRRGWL